MHKLTSRRLGVGGGGVDRRFACRTFVGLNVGLKFLLQAKTLRLIRLGSSLLLCKMGFETTILKYLSNAVSSCYAWPVK